MEYVLVLLLPALWPLISKYIWPHSISYREMGLNMVLPGSLAALVLMAGVSGKMGDTEIRNGQVLGKEKEWVSCEHDYDCNCRDECTGSGENRSCSEVCDTCYEHFNDWDWNVSVTDGVGGFTVDRIDRRGSSEPPRWTAITVGQPVAREHSYTNYVKAVPESLEHLRSSVLETYADKLPKYPRVYDYQFADRVIPIGVSLPDLAEWNNDLALKLRRLGPEKQANVIIVVVDVAEAAYANALSAHWVGGKKNDIVVVIGSPHFPDIAWVEVLAWTDEKIFPIKLRDSLTAIGTIERTAVIDTIDANVFEYYVRKPMKDFEYLKDEITPPTWAIVLAFLFATVGNVGLSLVFRKTDI